MTENPDDIRDTLDNWTQLVPTLQGILDDIRSILSRLEDVSANGWVTTDRIGNKQVTGAKVADKAIGTGQLADKGVTAAKLADAVNPTTLVKTVDVKATYTVPANGHSAFTVNFTAPTGYKAIGLSWLDTGNQYIHPSSIQLTNSSVLISMRNYGGTAVTKTDFTFARVVFIKNI